MDVMRGITMPSTGDRQGPFTSGCHNGRSRLWPTLFGKCHADTTMTEGYYKLARQIGGRGAFAEVKLSVDESAPPTTINVAESGPIAQHYIAAAKTGIEFAREQLIFEGQQPPHVNVTILEIIENPVDTSALFVVFAASSAFCDAIGMTLKRPVDFDFEHHRIVFPIGRPK